MRKASGGRSPISRLHQVSTAAISLCYRGPVGSLRRLKSRATSPPIHVTTCLAILVSSLVLGAILNRLSPTLLDQSGGAYGEFHLGGLGIVLAWYGAIVIRLRRLVQPEYQGVNGVSVDLGDQIPQGTMKLAAVRGAAAWLVVRNGARQGDVHEISGDKAIVGRGPECTVRLDDSSIAADHAVIWVQRGRYAVADLGSRTGTWVNGKLEAGAVLNDGSRISMGTSELFYTKVGAAKGDDSGSGDDPEGGVLLVRSGPSMGRSFHVWKGDMIIGSKPGDSGAQIDDPSISQHHALLRCLTKVCRLYDLASTNGTRVDDREMDGVVLQSGDILRFGEVEVQFVHEESS